MINKVTILGIEYDVVYLEDLIKREGLYGDINYNKQVIRIDNSMKNDRKIRTIIHEVLHGIMESLGYSEINYDEEKIQNISNALYLVAVNNLGLLTLFGL